MSTLDLEQIVAQMGALRRADGERRHAEDLIAERVFVALAPSGEHELFLRGERASFGPVEGGRVMEWGEYHIVGSGEALPALVVRTEATERGARLLSHVAYEAFKILQALPPASNTELVQRLSPFFALVLQSSLLSSQEQTGLMGELLFLQRLLSLGHTTIERRIAALGSWKGPDGSMRDFYNNKTAVEVKSSRTGFRHRVSMDQMLPAPGGSEDELFLCSVRLRRDRSAPLLLPEQVRRLEEILDENGLVDSFHEKLKAYGGVGYDPSLAAQYQLEPGYFAEVPQLRRLDSSVPVLRPSSFRSGEPPAGVSSIRYDLDVSSISPVPPAEEHRVKLMLIGAEDN